VQSRAFSTKQESDVHIIQDNAGEDMKEQELNRKVKNRAVQNKKSRTGQERSTQLHQVYDFCDIEKNVQ